MESAIGRNREKTYLTVLASIDHTGLMEPRVILWPDGRKFMIDKVESWRRPENHNSKTTAYTVEIKGQKRILYFSQALNCSIINMGRWYVET